MTALQTLFKSYREAAKTEREKGTYFEELIVTYLRYEATYADLYSDVWTYADWAKEQGSDGKDTGIDLVAKTSGTDEYHAIQCKFYAEDYRIQKKDIDSFFTASGKKPFTHRIIVTTTNNWSDNAEDALQGQQPPVSKIDLHDLENSQIDWSKFQPDEEPVLKEKYGLRPHQEKALKEVKDGIKNADRGKMIMACGTGKTFTSLRIAEELAGSGKRVLFLVPSLALLSQTLTEWTQQSIIPLHSFAVCSDSDIGKKRKKNDDVVQTFMHELRYPATTNAKALASEMDKRHDATHMSVVFSTYHSIAVINEAQHKHGLGDFDLIICDEAHRTTGATFEGEEESKFVKVHDNDFICAKKRIYMTATPRIYGDSAQVTAEKDNVALCSMDDESLYGKDIHVITFSEAVERDLLVDYKVIVLTVDEAHISTRLQRLLSDENNQLKVDDAAKIVGCWKALSKQDQEDSLADDSDPMQRAVAFCQVIEASTGKKTHKVSSKNIAAMFQAVVEAYQEQEDDYNNLTCEAAHVDGSMNATEKETKLQWLKAETPKDTCRILSNVRCLSEGVDVPALDAVLFLTPRNSQVDVVQSVGRIMRKAPNKKRGYVILPVVIPTGMEPSKALNDNKIYKVVWEVLQALRSHDDRFDAMINKLDLIGKDNRKMEVIAITDKINPKAKKTTGTKNKDAGKGSHSIGTPEQIPQGQQQPELQFEVGEIERALYAKVVKKCGNRNHWEDWAKDIAKIAKTHITRITTIVTNSKNKKEVAAFQSFAKELRDDLNDSITDDEVIEMLAQHLITKPVFDALFKEYSFASNNPVSQAMQHVLDILQEHKLEKEADTLDKFYASVQMRAEGIDNAEGKQKIVVELYDKFFRNAFPRMTERLGIVYTPVEVVDFIIHSVNDVLKSEFGQTLGSKGVHIIDPFTGTGTFITRLMQSGLISKEQLPHKYKNEIHANEIVLLAYYIAAINIEAVYHSLVGGDYQPFEGICLTDTFQLYEKDDLVSELMVDNSARRTRQKELDIRVIMANPPYSAGQSSANDENQNVVYLNLDESIRTTYAANSTATNVNALYDSYIRAIRWGSDRIGESGVMAYVSGSAWIERSFADGMRKSLKEEFTNLYVFHLRGDIRKNMLSKGRAKEGGNIFGSGSMTGVSISVLVKNPNAKIHGKIYYHDIGDDLSEIEKLEILSNFKSINGIAATDGWQAVVPDKFNDWLNQRDDSFDEFIEIGNKKDKSAKTIFKNYSRGIATGRDSWCYNASKANVESNMISMIKFYNGEVERLSKEKKFNNELKVESKLCTDASKISWTRGLKNDILKLKKHSYSSQSICNGIYRPFAKNWAYFSREMNDMIYQMPRIFPDSEMQNKVISISGIGARAGFTALMVDVLPCLDMVEKGQCFPLKIYEENVVEADDDLFASEEAETGYTSKDGIADTGLAHFKTAYPKEAITKEDIFYYIYGLLHSEEYRTRYADNLSKQLPHIPCVKKAKDFWAFTEAGRKLGELHVDYESAELYPVVIEGNPKTDKDYYVTKMKFGKVGKEKDKTTVIYNDHITIKDIPLEAYDYIVNGKAALDWVMDRQCVKTDKASGIVNDANLYATETVGDAKYPLELFQRLITVSLETMKIVRSLPPLDINTN
ncbi:MAG: DEAD/DEAH box helicase [Gammaproteobacteria bacterium]|nr:DEAD/DEAH box helicase [Gammaproteobacteria bacterium]